MFFSFLFLFNHALYDTIELSGARSLYTSSQYPIRHRHLWNSAMGDGDWHAGLNWSFIDLGLALRWVDGVMLGLPWRGSVHVRILMGVGASVHTKYNVAF